MIKLCRIKKFLALAVGSALCIVLSLPALAVSQYEIDQLTLRRQALAEQAAEQASRIEQLSVEQALFAERKLALDQCIELNRQEVQLLNEQIRLYNQMLEEKSTELNEAVYAEEQQSQALRTRMRAMEETTEMSYLSVLLESNSLSELLSRIADINDITRYDKELQETYRQARDNKAQIAQEYQDILLQQQDIQSELAARQSYLDEQIEAAQELIAALSEDSENAQAEYAAMEASLSATDAQIQQMIVALQQEYAAQRAAAASASSGSGSTGASSGTGVVSTGDLIWPLPSSNLVTSQYGNRDQPTAGASTNHQGLDINANEGDTVVSAAGGTVISAGSLGGYGNCVIVDHGNGVQTVYAHLSTVDVSVGQSVNQGEAIGGAGSTGISTGNHLHYEVRSNGTTTDPTRYYSDYSVWGG